MAADRGDLTGKVLGTSTLERLIGQGGMGVVYLARQLRPSRNVAVKVLLSSAAMNSAVYQDFLARFRREADVIARLEHINIMPIYDYGEQDGLAYLVMPYLTGGSLRDVLARRGVLSVKEAATYIDQAAAALDYAHAQGVIHRDLKPANFLLHADGRLVLADFGIARMMGEGTTGSTLTGTGMFLGTPEYMAPEMVSGESVDYRADIYELGVVLFQMLNGRVPFMGNTPFAVVTKHLQEPLPLLHQMNPLIPPAVDAIIQKATAKRREDRYVTAGALAQDLRTISAMQIPYDGNAPDNVPTAISSPRTVLSPAIGLQYNTPPPVQQPTPLNVAPWDPNQRAGSSASNYTPPPPGYQIYQTPPITTSPYTTSGNRQQPLLLFIGILLVIALIIGGVFVGLQLSRGTQGTTLVTTTSAPQPSATARTTTNTATATQQPTTVPSPTPTTASTSPTISVGTQLYAAANPGPNCDAGGGQWVDYNGAQVTCLAGKTRISNSSQSSGLAGTFLVNVPGHTFPADYVIQVQLQQDRNSSTDFGLYFRNQPGNQQGVYTFLVHPNGSWSAYVYDNTTGAPTELAMGTFGDAHAPVTVDVIVSGQLFTFYANGQRVGSVSDKTYSTGTAGIAVDQGGTIFVNNFALYLPAA